eukprot:UN03174
MHEGAVSLAKNVVVGFASGPEHSYLTYYKNMNGLLLFSDGGAMVATGIDVQYPLRGLVYYNKTLASVSEERLYLFNHESAEMLSCVVLEPTCKNITDIVKINSTRLVFLCALQKDYASVLVVDFDTHISNIRSNRENGCLNHTHLTMNQQLVDIHDIGVPLQKGWEYNGDLLLTTTKGIWQVNSLTEEIIDTEQIVGIDDTSRWFDGPGSSIASSPDDIQLLEISYFSPILCQPKMIRC